MPEPKDVRFYYFLDLSLASGKILKGKSCFHLKKVDAAMLAELDGMIKLGITLYQKDGMLLSFGSDCYA